MNKAELIEAVQNSLGTTCSKAHAERLQLGAELDWLGTAERQPSDSSSVSGPFR